ncbi:MAG: MarR family transcriptional regulator [Proteobacteria bacterium]|nr:MarR family transcriptional regulator [Pseudomonadota bacterium]MBI3496243.1 MarR family transcriptional regulator [Pseudomonadota bacterium]
MSRKTAKAPTPPTKVPKRGRGAARVLTAPADKGARPIDTSGLEGIIGYVIRRAQIAVFQDYNELAQDLGVTATQFAVMRLAAANPGLSQTALAGALGADTPRMVLIIDELERRRLVLRLASTVDRRSRAIFLTPEGRKLLAVMSRRVALQNRRMVKRLRGDDKNILLRMLQNLATPL